MEEEVDMEEEVEICELCKCVMGKIGTVVVTRGIDTLRAISLRKNDDLHVRLTDKQSVKVHVVCRRDYIRRITQVPKKEPEVVLRTSASPFDFKTDCIFCGKPTNIEAWKKHPDRFPPVSIVTTLSFPKTINSIAENRNDPWGETVKSRVCSVIDLVAAEAQYHRPCYSTFCKIGTSLPGTRESVRGPDPTKSSAFDKLCDYLENSNECQFLLSELQQRMAEFGNGECTYTEKYLKAKLEDHFGVRVLLTSCQGKSGTVVSFRDVASRVITDAWYGSRLSDEKAERKRIVEAAAIIIKEDICSCVYDCNTYPTALNMASGGREMVPETLQVLLEELMKPRKGNPSKKKTLTVAHSIISAARPRSFLSPLQLGATIYLHRKYRSRSLVDMFNHMGFCASYNEGLRYEASVTQNAPASITENALIQYVFDNADHNVRTVDGHGTFHVMGGVQCVTPASSVDAEVEVPRPKSITSASVLGTFGFTNIKMYDKQFKTGLGRITVEDVGSLDLTPSNIDSARRMDILWMSGSVTNVTCNVGWNGYMEMVCEPHKKQYEISVVLPLPIVNLDPSNPSAIFTCLEFAAEECAKRKQPACIVTFDQPLYVKAIDIVLQADANTPLASVIVRLGGFHLLMSFMGAVGHIMAGSGVEQLWEQVYAKNSVVQMLTGHAYARALRAHFLTQNAIAFVLLEICILNKTLPQETVEHLKESYERLLRKDGPTEDILHSTSVTSLISILQQIMEAEAGNSRTAALWIQYFNQVEIIRLFVRAERSGDWRLHLFCVQSMLPHFHAAGHFNYAKSAHLYLQQMVKLESRMSTRDFERFVEQGFFTIRRSPKFWSGIWTDMTIEQVLMNKLKTTGGISRGRGITPAILARWVKAMPASTTVVEAMESFAGVSSSTSEQHIELGRAWQARDEAHMNKLTEWLRVHSPFQRHHHLLVDISTGVVADENVNCDSAVQQGMAVMKRMEGVTFDRVKLQRKNKVVTLASMSRTVVVRGEAVPVNSNQLFHRIVCAVRCDEKLASCMEYELAPLPPALFDSYTIRKGTKSTLISVLAEQDAPSDLLPTNASIVLDGGDLLHRVVWPRPATYREICERYVSYITNKYGQDVTVVFDGYNVGPSTKDVEHMRRKAKTSSANVIVELEAHVITSQHLFLGNTDNKASFISLLGRQLELAGLHVRHATSDADTLIVGTALDIAQMGTTVVLVGEDTDLLVLLVALADRTYDVHMLIPGTKTRPMRVFNIKKLQTSLGYMQHHILFIHAISGCDSTSALFRKGKKMTFNKLKNNSHLRQRVEVFNQSASSANVIASAGEEFLVALYGGKSSDGLDKTRHKLYVKTVAKQTVNARFDLANLPPTSAAARQHSLRVFLQVQEWRGVRLPPTDWGWKLTNGELRPVSTLLPPAPDMLLNLVSCDCKNDCDRDCDCQRAGLSCSVMCKFCNGDGCSNQAEPIHDEQTSEEEEELPEETFVDDDEAAEVS